MAVIHDKSWFETTTSGKFRSILGFSSQRTFAANPVWGTPIPVSGGKRMLTGTPIWVGELISRSYEPSQPPPRPIGTPGGAPPQLDPLDNPRGAITFPSGGLIRPPLEWVGDFAVSFGKSALPPGESIDLELSRMWIKGILVYDRTGGGAIRVVPGMTFVFYKGTNTQLPDPIIAAKEGPNTPAFRDLIYAVFRDCPINGDKTIPTVTVEVVDRFTSTFEITEFSQLDETAYPHTVASFVDFERARWYTFLGSTWNTAAPLVQEFDLDLTTELRRISLEQVAGVSQSNIAGIDNWIAFDPGSQTMFTWMNGVQNKVPHAGWSMQTGARSYFFGEESAGGAVNSATGLAVSAFGVLVESKVGGLNGRGILTASYLHELAVMAPYLQLKWPAGNLNLKDPQSTGTENPNSWRTTALCQYPVLGRSDLEDQYRLSSSFQQDWTCFAGIYEDFGGGVITDKLYRITGSSDANGGMAIAGMTELYSEANHMVRELFIDLADYNLVAVLMNRTTLAHRMIKLRTTPSDPVLSGYSPDQLDNRADVNWSGIYPETGAVIWDVPIPDWNLAFVKSVRQSRIYGRFAWTTSGTNWTIIDLVDGAQRTVAVNIAAGAWSYDALQNAAYVTRGPDLAYRIYFDRHSDASSDILLADFLVWISVLAGYDQSDIIIEGITESIHGFIIDQPFDYSELISHIAKAYNFFWFQTGDGKVKFVKVQHGAALIPTLNLVLADLAPAGEGGAQPNECLVTELTKPTDVPAAVTVTYYDSDLGYTVSTQTFNRSSAILPDTGSSDAMEIILPFIMTASEAMELAVNANLSNEAGSISQTFRLPWRFLRVEPTDVIRINHPPYVDTVLVNEATFNGDKTVSIFGVNVGYQTVADTPVNTTPIPEPFIPLPSPTITFVFDTPLLRPSDDRNATFTVYTGAGPVRLDQWTGATIWRGNVSGQWTAAGSIVSPTLWGTAISALPDAAPWMIHYDAFLDVLLDAIDPADLASASHLDFLAGANAVLVGRTGRWELIYFRDVTMVGPRTARLSTLIRGMRGTELMTGTHGQSGGNIVAVVASVAPSVVADVNTSMILRDMMNLGMADQTVSYSAVGDNSRDTQKSETLTLAPTTKECWAVANIKAVRQPV